jgi:hypothetical protein
MNTFIGCRSDSLSTYGQELSALLILDHASRKERSEPCPTNLKCMVANNNDYRAFGNLMNSIHTTSRDIYKRRRCDEDVEKTDAKCM